MKTERIYLVIRKEMILLFRSKRILAISLLVPAILVLLTGFAFTENIKNVPTIVINQDQGLGGVNDGIALTNQLKTSDQLDVKYLGNMQTVQTGVNLIRTGRYSALVVIPHDFTNRVRLGKAIILVYVDGADPVTGYTCSSAIMSIAEGFGSQSVVQTDPDFLFNPNVGHASSSVQLNFLRFIGPGILGVMLGAVLTSLSSTAIVGERERGSFEQLLVSPISGAELLMGKILFYVLAIGLFNIAAILFVLNVLLGVPIVGSPVLVFLLSFIYVVASVGMGVLISVTSKTMLQAFQMSTYVTVVQVFLCGITYPIKSIPLIIRPISYLMPLTYLGEGLRNLMIRGAGFDAVAIDFLAVTIYLVAMYLLAVHFFRKKIEE